MPLKLNAVRELRSGTRNLMFLLLMFFLMFHGEDQLKYNQETLTLESTMIIEIEGEPKLMRVRENETDGVYQNIMFHLFIFLSLIHI